MHCSLGDMKANRDTRCSLDDGVMQWTKAVAWRVWLAFSWAIFSAAAAVTRNRRVATDARRHGARLARWCSEYA
jgi:hypothetical protein